MEETKILLTEKEMPTKWYNILPDLPAPLEPPLHPATKQPIGPDDLAPLFPMELIMQEFHPDRYVDIPEDILNIYALFRPSPLYRAHRLEKAIGSRAKIYYKYEGVSPAGSHKPNTAIPQAYYNMKAGVKRLATETGAGQWGSAVSLACNYFGLECTVYMVGVSYDQKPYRRTLMEVWGSTVHKSPSNLTNAGRGILEKDPDSPGSLGIAISEAVEDAATHDDTKYALGSVLNHVLLHQTIIGEEAKLQLAKVGEYPTVVIGCCGGGSNLGGITFPFARDKFEGKEVRLVAVEPTACPTLTKGEFRYDFGDTAEMAPMVKMYTMGHEYIPAPIHAGGLRYHGDSPIISLLVNQGIMEAYAYDQNDIFTAALIFAKSEGILPAPESAHAILRAIDEAKNGTEKDVILFNLSGHGHFDLGAYDSFIHGQMK